MSTWRAGCAETCTSGSEGGSQKPTGRKTGRALRPDPYTYIPTWAGWLYLAVVLNVFSRRVVGWAMATHLRTEPVLTRTRSTWPSGTAGPALGWSTTAARADSTGRRNTST